MDERIEYTTTEGPPTPTAPSPEIMQSAAALEVISRAETDVQIATAKKFPLHGNVHDFVRRAKALVLLDRESAERCTYALPRGGKTIKGPSTYFAHSLCPCWGNIRVQSRIVGIDETGVVVQGVAMDLEANYAISAEVRKTIVGKDGRRFTNDMITMASMGASSIARRNAILNVIPRSYWEPIWKETKAYAASQDKRTLSEQRAAAVAYFEKRGVSQRRMLEALEKKGIEDLDQEDIDTLRGIRVSLEENETTIDEAFPLPAQVKKSGELPNLAEALEKAKKGATHGRTPEGTRAPDAGPREPGSDG